MSNSKYYLYGEDVTVPAHLNLGKYIIDKIRDRSNMDAIAVEDIDTQHKLSYMELIQYAVNLSTSLTKLGVGRGDTVGVGCEKRNDLLPVALAIIFTGATCTMFELEIGKTNFKHQLNISQSTYFLSSKQFWSRNKNVIQDVDCIKMILSLDDPFDAVQSVKNVGVEHVDVKSFEPATVYGQTDVAFIMYSSGTTGLSKGIQQTHLLGIIHNRSICFQGESIETAFIYRGDWNSFDLHFALAFLVMGIKIVYSDKKNTESLLRAIDHYKVNLAVVVPALLRLFIKESKFNELLNLGSLRLIFTGTCPLHKDTIETVKQRFPNLKHVLQLYGLTETINLSSEFWSNKGPKPGSVGSVGPGVTMKVSDLETRKTLGPNERGEICVKTPGLIKAYVGMDTSYGRDDEGFFRTGDLGYYDDDGYLYIVERLKEIISYDGYNIVPLELENILQIHPEVKDAAVVGKPDPIFEELPTAFVVRVHGSNVSEKELIDYVSGEVPPFMQLRGGIKFIEEIPKNLRGKILRHSLRNMLTEN